MEYSGRKIKCPKCGKYHTLVKNGYRDRDIVALPIGSKRTVLHMKVQRYKCKECDYDQQEHISFTTGGRAYTHRFSKFVVDLKTGRILYVGDGKSEETLEKFWKLVKRKGVKIRYVATDMSPAFTNSVRPTWRKLRKKLNDWVGMARGSGQKILIIDY